MPTIPNELTVREVMQANPVAVRPDRTVGDLLLMMNQLRIGSVLVIDESERLIGIFTERDLLRRVSDAVIGWRNYPVAEWMTKNPHSIGPEVGWEGAVQTMTRLSVRHLPVVEEGKVVGLLSTRMLMARRAEVLNAKVEDRTRELRRANDQLISRDQEVLHNLRAAGKLQMKLLPHAAPDWPELRWAVHFAPLDHLGGDYYDFAEPDADHLGFLIADASGHSVPAAMVAVLARFAFNEVAEKSSSPGKVLAQMNSRLQEVTDERFVSAFYSVFDRKKRVLKYANAGHPYPLLYDASEGTVKPLVAQGFLLGIIPDEVYTEREVTLEPGDLLCFCTDGILEARNEIGEQYGEDRLTRAIRKNSLLLADELRDAILEDHTAFCGGVPSTDDITLAICHLVKSTEEPVPELLS